MIAKSHKTALLAAVTAAFLGLGFPLGVQANERDSHHDAYRHGHARGHYEREEHHHWRDHDDYYRPRGYSDVVIYREAPRAYYYYAPAEPVYPVYPSDYDSVGIHLDYNLRY